MLTYAQIGAIRQAILECEEEKRWVDSNGHEASAFLSEDVEECFAKIRAALAGEKASDDGSP